MKRQSSELDKIFKYISYMDLSSYIYMMIHISSMDLLKKPKNHYNIVK